MRKLLAWFQENNLKIFLVAFFLFRLPPFYLIPGLKTVLLTTQSVARVLFMVVAVSLMVIMFKTKESVLEKRIEGAWFLSVLILVFFLELSLGVFWVRNLSHFLLRYKDVFMGVVMFFLGLQYGDELERIAKVVLGALLISIVYQLVILVVPDFFVRFFDQVVYEKHFEIVKENIERGRVYLDLNDGALLPLVLVFLEDWVFGFKGVVGGIVFFVVGLLAFLSNVRSRFVVYFVSAVGYVVVKLEEAREKVKGVGTIFWLLLAVFVGGLIAYYVGEKVVGFSFWDRVVMDSEVEDVNTLIFRLEQLGFSLDVARVNKGLGLGLGNLYENLSFAKKWRSFTLGGKMSNPMGAAQYIHSILGTFFAEGGVVGGVIFLVILGKFIFDDLQLWRVGDEKNKVLLVSFWSLFVFALFNPFVPFVLQGLFWFLRGMLSYRLQIET